MSTSPVLTSLKLAMIAKIKEKAKLKEDTVSNLAAMRNFITALADYYDQGGLRPFHALISKAAMKAIAPKFGRQFASIDDRENFFSCALCVAQSRLRSLFPTRLRSSRLT